MTLLPDAARRAANIREKGEIYRQQHFPRTGDLLLQLAEVVETGQGDRREGIFNQIAPTYRDEYSEGDAQFLALYDLIEGILIGSNSANRAGFSEKLLEITPLIASMRRAATVMGQMASSFLRAGRRTPPSI